ncbi:MAG: Mrp/NBP35 family ATP-binding protein [Lachnospiraceae bacterium]|nr:Mrp/NBP35 family ATP-binding protein [Lachnospiraceae bacterium]
MADSYTKKAGDIKPPKQKQPKPVSKPEDFSEPMNAESNIKKVIGIVSGKGGVGKSLMTGLLAVAAGRAGKKVAILDADVTGPSIPKMFGVHEKAMSDGTNIIPAVSEGGIKMMSTNLILDDEKEPVIWRGPVIAGVVKQFWREVLWGDVDVLFVDMPPGTGDVPLTVFQSLPVDGIVVVTSPQELVSMIVEKAARMAEMMNIPLLGLIENMSFITCPDCGRRIYPFGEGKVEGAAAGHGIELTAKMPIEPFLAALCDAGRIEAVPDETLADLKKFV